MRIPFTKAHGAGNDFLFTWKPDAPGERLEPLARAICNRHTGAGADGWYLMDRDAPECDAAISLYNSDGSTAELSGNGTRCAAALLVKGGLAGNDVAIQTGAGLRRLRLLSRDGLRFRFEMDMGAPVWEEPMVRFRLPLTSGEAEVTVLDVGNPQCAVFVNEFPDDWLTPAAEIEAHPRFPNRTNVSFVRPLTEHTVEARFYERGAGETLSSGTGSIGAAVAAILRGVAKSPVTVSTPAGPLEVRWDTSVCLTGPAEIVADGNFYWSGQQT
ncbi:MAG: diaminopimelate epimerase [bacterium]|nr:diaminopimelate epimerase [bacterium]